VAALKISPSTFRDLASESRSKRVKEFLSVLAPQTKTLAAIRATARKKGKSKLSAREIDREIRAFRRDQQP
jgi:hypothetical protein